MAAVLFQEVILIDNRSAHTRDVLRPWIVAVLEGDVVHNDTPRFGLFSLQACGGRFRLPISAGRSDSGFYSRRLLRVSPRGIVRLRSWPHPGVAS